MDDFTEDQEALEVIADLDERTNVEEIDVAGKMTAIIHKGYASRHFFEIEKFVKAVETGWRGFSYEVTHYGHVGVVRELYLAKHYYRYMNDWLERYSDVHRYSARVEVFYDVCKELGLIGQCPFAFGEPGEIARVDGARYMDAFNILIEKIRARCQSREFKERERLRKANAERNKRNVLAMEEAMYSKDTGRSRWLVLSLTLRYQPKFRRWITPEIIQQHRDRFFSARRFNKLMSGIKNHVWTIEEGEDTGLHLHVILFYSFEHNHDEYIAQQICEYWVSVVTEGRGAYWNGNAKRLKTGYKNKRGVGVGQINWKEGGKRKALRKNLVYLTKAEQYVMLKGVENMHTFGMGKIPRKIKPGRPRGEIDASSTIENAFDVELFDEANEDATNADQTQSE